MGEAQSADLVEALEMGAEHRFVEVEVRYPSGAEAPYTFGVDTGQSKDGVDSFHLEASADPVHLNLFSQDRYGLAPSDDGALRFWLKQDDGEWELQEVATNVYHRISLSSEHGPSQIWIDGMEFVPGQYASFGETQNGRIERTPDMPLYSVESHPWISLRLIPDPGYVVIPNLLWHRGDDYPFFEEPVTVDFQLFTGKHKILSPFAMRMDDPGIVDPGAEVFLSKWPHRRVTPWRVSRQVGRTDAVSLQYDGRFGGGVSDLDEIRVYPRDAPRPGIFTFWTRQVMKGREPGPWRMHWQLSRPGTNDPQHLKHTLHYANLLAELNVDDIEFHPDYVNWGRVETVDYAYESLLGPGGTVQLGAADGSHRVPEDSQLHLFKAGTTLLAKAIANPGFMFFYWDGHPHSHPMEGQFPEWATSTTTEHAIDLNALPVPWAGGQDITLRARFLPMIDGRALDNNSLPWASWGPLHALQRVATTWLEHPDPTAQGGSCLRSFGGSDNADQYSYLITRVQGPGTLKFSWKNPFVGGYFGRFFVGTSLWSSLPGGIEDWRREGHFIPEGEHLLLWRMQPGVAGSTTPLFLDAVEWIPGADARPVIVRSDGHGTVSLRPDKSVYMLGETVILHCEPDSGWVVDQIGTELIRDNRTEFTLTVGDTNEVHVRFAKVISNPDAASGDFTFYSRGRNPWGTGILAEGDAPVLISGFVDDANPSVLRTTVTGPGKLSFDWFMAGHGNGFPHAAFYVASGGPILSRVEKIYPGWESAEVQVSQLGELDLYWWLDWRAGARENGGLLVKGLKWEPHWIGATITGSDGEWNHSSVLGELVSRYPWFYSKDLQWMQVEGEGTTGIYLFIAAENGWFWTSAEVYPFSYALGNPGKWVRLGADELSVASPIGKANPRATYPQ